MDSNNSGYASRAPQSAPLSLWRRLGDRSVTPPAQRHAFRRLQTRQQYLPLLVATTVLTLLMVIIVGYVAARATTMSAAQASASTNAQIAREVISERGQYPAIVNKQLVASGGVSNYTLVNDTGVVDHVRQLTGNWAVIYQLTGTTSRPSLVSVAANLPKTDGLGHDIANTRATNQPLPPDAQAALIGACGPVNASTACYGDYSGVVTIAGVSYVAGFEPLLGQNGNLVGAVGVMTPLDEVLAAPKQLAILLLMAGLLVGLIVVAVGMWLVDQFPNRLLRQLDGQLDMMAHAAVELGRLAHQQQFRLHHQQRAARQVGEHAMKLESLASEMDDGQEALHQTSTAIWEEMSQPGVALNAATALRLAREAAVRASEVGMAGDATRAHARQVIMLMNQVIAEGRALAQEGQEAESHANELAATLDRMETDLGEHLTPHRYDLGSAPLIRHITDASDRLRQMLQAVEGAATNPRKRATGQPPHRTGGPRGAAGDGLSGLSLGDEPGRFRSPPLHGKGPFNGFPGASGSRHGGYGGKSGNGGRRPAGDSPAPPGGLPPLGRFDDDPPPRGPNDSHWLNDK
jgi:hypothetical protein